MALSTNSNHSERVLSPKEQYLESAHKMRSLHVIILLMTKGGEQWKDVVGFENKYQVSSHGRIKIKERMDSVGHRMIRGGLKSTKKLPKGYEQVNLSFDGTRKYKYVYVHRLVAEHFLPRQDGLTEVNHVDFNRGNNRVENLEWTTRSGNMRHTVKHNRHPSIKFGKSTFDRILELLNMGLSQPQVAKEVGCSKSYVYLVKKNKIFRFRS